MGFLVFNFWCCPKSADLMSIILCILLCFYAKYSDYDFYFQKADLFWSIVFVPIWYKYFEFSTASVYSKLYTIFHEENGRNLTGLVKLIHVGMFAIFEMLSKQFWNHFRKSKFAFFFYIMRCYPIQIVDKLYILLFFRIWNLIFLQSIVGWNHNSNLTDEKSC